MVMDFNMGFAIEGVPFKDGEDGDRILLDGLDTFDQWRDLYYVYSAIPPIRGDGGRKTYKEAYDNTNDNVVIEKVVGGDMEFIPDGMNSSEWIENIYNEFIAEQRVDDEFVADEIIDEAIEVEQSIAEEKKISYNKKWSVVC